MGQFSRPFLLRSSCPKRSPDVNCVWRPPEFYKRAKRAVLVVIDFECSGTIAIVELSSLHMYHTLVWVKMWATYGHSLITVRWSSLVERYHGHSHQKGRRPSATSCR